MISWDGETLPLVNDPTMDPYRRELHKVPMLSGPTTKSVWDWMVLQLVRFEMWLLDLSV